MRGFERCAFAACIAFAAMPAMADWKDDYARGLEAARAGRWNDVARYMNDALVGNAQPVARLRLYGQRYETYAPQHYAGLAALRLGDCTAALRYWSQPANTAFVAGNAQLLQEQQKGRADCGSRLAAQPPPAQEPPRASSAPVAAAPIVQTNAPSPSRPPQSEPQRPVASAPRDVPRQPTTPAPAPTPPRVVQQPAPSPPATQPAPAAAVAGQSLRPLLAAYLGGRYAEVLTLSARAPDDPRLRWHALTLRAAAAFTLAQLGEDAKAQSVADQAVADARRTNPALKPDPKFYSPTFISYFSGRQGMP